MDKLLYSAKDDSMRGQQPKTGLSSGQRHREYRLGLLAASQILKKLGFSSNAEECDSVLSFDKKGVYVDVKIVKPASVAYVTSRSQHDPVKEVTDKLPDGSTLKRPAAKVVFGNSAMDAPLVLRLVVTCVKSASGTRNPVFIPLYVDEAKPARYVCVNVVRTLLLLSDDYPELKEAMTPVGREIVDAETLDIDAIDLGSFGENLLPNDR